MGRVGMLGAGLVAGVLISGLVAGLVLPLAPEAWRNPPIVWGSSAIVVAICLGVAFLLSRPSRE
ncbi:MAG: hypothetical protein U0Q55_03595 [Vicinamibacterales bacterium]